MADLRLHLLIAEDDPDLRAVLQTALTGAGFRVTAAPDGGVATELLELGDLADGELHAVILDVRMPEATGIDVLRWLRSDARRVPVVLVSGFADGVAAVGRALGAAVLAKPFSIEQLAGAMTEARALAGRSTMPPRSTE